MSTRPYERPWAFVERFEKFLDRESQPPHAIWTGHVDANGCPIFRPRPGVRVRAYAFARELAGLAAPPPGRNLRKTCDVRLCVLADHWVLRVDRPPGEPLVLRRVADLSDEERTAFIARFRNGAKVGALERRFGLLPIEAERFTRALMEGQELPR